MIKIGALWNSNGKPFARGKLGNYASLVVMPNNNKQSDKSPDYWVFVAEDDKKEEKPVRMEANSYEEVHGIPEAVDDFGGEEPF